MNFVREFFRDIDRRWRLPHAEKVRLRIIGSTALMLQTDYARGTKDSDVIETASVTPEIKRHLLALAPKDKESESLAKYRMYIDIVAAGLPFLPQAPICHSLTDLNTELVHLELEVLDVVDVVVSKLKRFHADDRRDILAMVDLDLLDNDLFVERFRAAIDYFSMDARAGDLPDVVKNFHHVQYEMLMTSVTPIELPDGGY